MRYARDVNDHKATIRMSTIYLIKYKHTLEMEAIWSTLDMCPDHSYPDCSHPKGQPHTNGSMFVLTIPPTKNYMYSNHTRDSILQILVQLLKYYISISFKTKMPCNQNYSKELKPKLQNERTKITQKIIGVNWRQWKTRERKVV